MPSVCRTWGLRGLTPHYYHRQRREKVSVISALSVSPRRRHVGLYFHCLPNANFDAPAVVVFLRHLLRHLRGSVIVIWDNGKPHKGKVMRAFLRRCTRLHLESLPPYAPELNPDEGVWNQTRRVVANGCPDNATELQAMLQDILSTLRAKRSKLRWCFRQSDLPPFLPRSLHY